MSNIGIFGHAFVRYNSGVKYQSQQDRYSAEVPQVIGAGAIRLAMNEHAAESQSHKARSAERRPTARWESKRARATRGLGESLIRQWSNHSLGIV